MSAFYLHTLFGWPGFCILPTYNFRVARVLHLTYTNLSGPPLPGLVSSFSSWSCCNTVIILVVRCVPTAAFENESSSLYRGAGDQQAIRVWRIDGRSHSWEPATGWVFVGQSFCQFHWSWLARLADFFMQAGSFCSGGTLSSCFFGTG